MDKKISVLASLRKEAGMTQKKLADVAGVNIRQIQRIEDGTSEIGNITLGNAVAIARALGVTAEELLLERGATMTYRHYILSNKLADSKEAYRAYCEEYNTVWGVMSPAMRDQFIEANYGMRYAIQWS